MAEVARGLAEGRPSVPPASGDCMASEPEPLLRYYRAYQVDPAGHICSPPDVINAEDDEEALRLARALANGNLVEVWEQGRLVGRLEPD
jgi:hypothetical protein